MKLLLFLYLPVKDRSTTQYAKKKGHSLADFHFLLAYHWGGGTDIIQVVRTIPTSCMIDETGKASVCIDQTAPLIPRPLSHSNASAAAVFGRTCDSQVISTARTCNMLLICLDVMKVRLYELRAPSPHPTPYCPPPYLATTPAPELIFVIFFYFRFAFLIVSFFFSFSQFQGMLECV